MAITSIHGYIEAIDAMWAAMRRRETFTVREIADATGYSTERVRAYVNACITAGYVKPVGIVSEQQAGAREQRALTLVRDTGIEAPRIDRQGRPMPPSMREQLWRTARILKRFTLREIVIQAATEECQPTHKAASVYFGWLAKAGIVSRRRTRNGVVYQLIASRSGPLYPLVSRANGRYRVIDRNTGQVWEEGSDD